MLAVWPESVMKSVAGSGIYKVLVRPSMQKFPSDRNNLEVLLYSFFFLSCTDQNTEEPQESVITRAAVKHVATENTFNNA